MAFVLLVFLVEDPPFSSSVPRWATIEARSRHGLDI
jgi:hypothetical protein